MSRAGAIIAPADKAFSRLFYSGRSEMIYTPFIWLPLISATIMGGIALYARGIKQLADK
jgi:ABC-type maltose transport system permease subunit